MSTILGRLFLLLAISASTAVAGAAQLAANKAPATVPRASSERLTVGEVLTYEGKINKVIRGLSVADLKFEVTRAATGPDLVIKTEAESKGTLLKLFRFSFLQQYQTTVDATQFRALRTTKHDVQKDRVRDSEAIFDYSLSRVSYVETDPADPNRAPRRIASKIDEPETHDMVSAVFALRTMPLAVGSRFQMTLSDSGLVFTVPVRVVGREKVKSVLGQRWCFRIEPLIFGKGRLIEQKGRMIIWISDDERRIPIRASIDTAYGNISVRLRSASIPGEPAAAN